MHRLLECCMAREKIEYYSVLDYRDCVVTAERIEARMGFSPKSAILMLLPYFVDRPANISIYAASLDYHLAVAEITGRIIDSLKSSYPEYSYLGFGDHSPIDERRAALSAGLGVMGKNRLLINEKYGSYCFIAEVLTDAPSELLNATKPQPVSHCMGCNACVFACPTGALREEGVACLSDITQRKGEILPYEADVMRRVGTAWGCDICQLVCPHNQSPEKTPIEFFYRDRIDSLSLDVLSSLSDEQFKKRAFSWRTRKTVERNLHILGSENDGK